MSHDLFRRWPDNPILELEDMPFKVNSVFNGTPVKIDDEYLLLLRVEGQQGYSFFALARSDDGYHFKVEKDPVLLPAKFSTFATYERLGIEDPRATLIEGEYYVVYTAVSSFGHRIAIARTKDFRSYERLTMSSAPGNKDGVLFPEKIDGRFVRFDRPIGANVGSIWISYSKDMRTWGHSRVVMSPRPGYWDAARIGASATPIRTDEGWLEIYHGFKMTSAGPIYRTGSVLLDLEDPTRVIARCSVPLLSPRESYERVGDVNNVVFAAGCIVEPDGEVKLYYGAADTCICVAVAHLDEIIACTLNGRHD